MRSFFKLFFLIFSIYSPVIHCQIISTVVGDGSGTAGSIGDGGQANLARLNNPLGLTFDNSNNLYIADLGNNKVRKISSSGIISTFAGNGVSGYSGDGGQAINAKLNGPSGVTIDGTGNLLIVDYSNNIIRKVNTSGIISTIAGTISAGFGGDGGQASLAQMAYPSNTIIDAIGNIYVSDTYNYRIRKISTTGIISTIAGNGTLGYSGDGGQATLAELYYPLGMAIDAAGNLYFADSGNNRIRMINTSGVISTIAGIGTPGFSGDGGLATSAKLNSPNGLVFDSFGNLYFTDRNNSRIRMINTSGIISTIAGSATSGAYMGDGGLATAARLNHPAQITLDNLGNLYFTDNYNNCVRKVTNVTTNINQQLEVNDVLQIFPNPTDNIFSIITKAETLIIITNVFGEIVLTQQLQVGKNKINLNNHSSGIYFIKNNNSIFKLIKQ